MLGPSAGEGFFYDTHWTSPASRRENFGYQVCPSRHRKANHKIQDGNGYEHRRSQCRQLPTTSAGVPRIMDNGYDGDWRNAQKRHYIVGAAHGGVERHGAKTDHEGQEG